MGGRWRRELAHRRREARARAMIKAANRTWQQHPTRLNAMFSGLVGRVVESQMQGPVDSGDLYLEE